METLNYQQIPTIENDPLKINQETMIVEEIIEHQEVKVVKKITKPALRRILKRCGVKFISESVFDVMRLIIKDFSTEIIKRMVIFVKASKRKTVQVEDLTAALSILNISLAAGLNINSKKGTSIQSCTSAGKSGPVKKSMVESDKSHKFRPGTKSNRTITYHQKNSEWLAIPKLNFEKLIRNISLEYLEDLRFSEGVIDLLQLVVEDHIISICKKAYECTLFSYRDTINSRDIELTLKILDLY